MNICDDILNLCSENKATFEKALSLTENISDVAIKYKIEKVLQDGMSR